MHPDWLRSPLMDVTLHFEGNVFKKEQKMTALFSHDLMRTVKRVKLLPLRPLVFASVLNPMDSRHDLQYVSFSIP